MFVQQLEGKIKIAYDRKDLPLLNNQLIIIAL